MTLKSDRTGRIAGALYVVVIVTGMFSLAYVPGQIQLAGERVGRSQHHNKRNAVSARYRVVVCKLRCLSIVAPGVLPIVPQCIIEPLF